MYIGNKTEEDFRIIEDALLYDHLKLTENGRYLFQYKGRIDEYRIKLRVSFPMLCADREMIETEHMRIEKQNDFSVKMILSVNINDFFKSEELNAFRCTYQEKVKGMDIKCKIDRIVSESI